MKQVYKKYKLGDMSALYLTDDKSNAFGLMLLPDSLTDQIILNEGWWGVEPLVQIKVIGDTYADSFSNGHTMRNNGTSNALRFKDQKVEEGNVLRVTSTLVKDGLEVRHILEYQKDALYMNMYTEVESHQDEKLGLEMISSYNVCGFSALGENLRMEDFVLHRLQSKWSNEGKLESTPFLDLQLEPAWIRIGANSIRFGEVGSMPVRRYFPWMIAEDKKYGYSIGIQLAHPTSWQMEVYNRDDKIALSGGIADREFGHWVKYLNKNEVFKTPVATLTVAKEDIDGISYRLTTAQNVNLKKVPECEKELPIVFNEYCTSWGNPTEQEMLAIIDKLKGHGIKYCVIDAGWHVKDGVDWSDIGDWIVNKNRFPHGLRFIADAVREAGMIPGLWYEMENVGQVADIFTKEEFLLKRDGYPIQTGQRRFLDMRKPEVIEYLTEKVINNLRDWNFGYLKVDYNDNIGIGCDGAESLGEGLRQSGVGTQGFFRKIREEIPDIVIENCSSGGHRIEPSMQAITSMASFSDAHECKVIPVIAANVTRAILPAQSQIWAVLRKGDDEQRFRYSIVNTFLGRMCLSGDISALNDWQWSIVDEGIQFYKECASIIKDGRNYRQGPKMESYNHLKGWQAVCRVAGSGQQQLVIVHSFDDKNGELTIQLPVSEGKNWKVANEYYRNDITIALEDNRLTIRGMKAFDAAAVRLVATK